METGRKVASLALAVAALLLWAASGAHSATDVRGDPMGAPLTAPASTMIQYQGRLTDPSTGAPVADGTYTMVFRLYNVSAGGTALWTELKDVSVTGGLFSTALGDTSALSQSLLNGQQLWLGIKVGTDAEATPRQAILPAAYALGLVPGAVVEANSGQAAVRVRNTGSGEALHVEGATSVTGNLAVSGSLTGGTHAHSGTDITSGTVADARVAATLARDSEVMGLVQAGDGTGSNLDADLLDGQHGAHFAEVGHNHWNEYWTGSNTGLLVATSSGIGIEGTSTDYIGVMGINWGPASGIGLYGRTAATGGTGIWGYSQPSDGSGIAVGGGSEGGGYGFYTLNLIHVGACVGCTVVLIGTNVSQETLLVGEAVVVTGVGPVLQGHSTPVIEVRHATPDDVSVLGVVQARGIFSAARAERPEVGDMVRAGQGDVEPGDYVLIVVEGMAQVRVELGLAAVTPGQSLTVAGTPGRITTAGTATLPNLIFGRAMETEPDANGLLWALIDAQ